MSVLAALRCRLQRTRHTQTLTQQRIHNALLQHIPQHNFSAVTRRCMSVSAGGAVEQPGGSGSPSDTQSGHSFLHPKPGTLSHRVEQLVPQYTADFKDLKERYGSSELGKITVSQVLGGMRGMIGLLWDCSLLDANEGIRFRGLSIPEVQAQLPRGPRGEQPLPEGLLWLLLTGEVPTDKQVKQVTRDLHARSKIPANIKRLINKIDPSLHAMSQLIISVTLLQQHSVFAAGYQHGINKNDYWKYQLEDALNLIAKLPEVAKLIYRNKYHGGKPAARYNRALDYSANFANMLGFENEQFHDLMRLYLVIHSDHEGGNVSAHTTHLVGSALSDPYLSYAAGMAGLAGPLHGLANQEVLRWLAEFKAENNLGDTGEWSKQQLIDACNRTLSQGRVIPGYGHAVLRKTDPRYTAQREFALKHLPDDPMFKLVSDLYEVVPNVLSKQGKVSNPWPNVDAHSGVLLQHYGLKEADYYTVLFGVSRAIGVLSQLIIDRILRLPLERPKSVTSQWIRDKFSQTS